MHRLGVTDAELKTLLGIRACYLGNAPGGCVVQRRAVEGKPSCSRYDAGFWPITTKEVTGKDSSAC